MHVFPARPGNVFAAGDMWQWDTGEVLIVLGIEQCPSSGKTVTYVYLNGIQAWHEFVSPIFMLDTHALTIVQAGT